MKRRDYIQIDKDILIEGRPIIAGPVFHTSGMSEILHCIMEPALSLIPHIVKDSEQYNVRTIHYLERAVYSPFIQIYVTICFLQP